MITGSMVALVTPMNINGEIDYVSLDKLLQYHLSNDTAGLVILGTTGESATVSDDEHIEMLRYVIDVVAGQIPIISGVGTFATESTILKAQADTELGVDALLVVTPYYNKPTQEGLYQHYKKLAQEVNNNIILYNVPGRTAVDLLPETVSRLTQFSNIIGIKETLSPARVAQLRQVVPQDFSIYSGDDASNLAMLELGAQGFISVTANVAPKRLQEMYLAHVAGNSVLAETIHEQLMPLHRHLFIEANPIPVKFALAEMGLINCGIRLPLTWLALEHQETVRDAMRAAHIITPRGNTCLF